MINEVRQNYFYELYEETHDLLSECLKKIVTAEPSEKAKYELMYSRLRANLYEVDAKLSNLNLVEVDASVMEDLIEILEDALGRI